METRKDSLSVLKLCRFCLSQEEPLTSLYAKSKVRRDNISFSLKILSCISIEVFPSEKMLTYICNRCRTFMELFYEFKQICRMSDENILRYVQNGTALESIEWHPLLVKTYLCAARQLSKLTDVKSTEDDSNTLIASQDNTDSDNEEDDEVYNIKIGDGSDEGSKDRISCIKVMNIDESGDIKKPQNEDGASGRNRSGSILGRFPCDCCDRTYPLQQLLELHMAKMHRTRDVQCQECDAKFFSKYDLQVHEIRHSDEMPFQCVACRKKFKRLILLKRHEKLMHSELPQQRCPHCPATFLSEEELESHQQKHRPFIKPFICDICDKKFHAKAFLQKHKSLMHEEKFDLPFVCQYCPQNFSTVSKLTRHLRSHAGAKLFPCKFCKKNFVKSHHYTRHLRIKHREEMSQEEAQSEQYRCEQCSESFATQDDLIYHSAIHATQNLTCPLCQERFPNVDAVTAHVKSHVTGMEYMCELCELVFTSQQKLNNHHMTVHVDEINNEQELDEDESSMDNNEEEDDDDNVIQLKEEDGQMVVEINKADSFIIQGDDDDKTVLEDSEMELPQVEPQKPATKTPNAAVVNDTDKNQTAAILKKAEEIKRKAQQNLPEPVPAKKAVVKVENNNTGGASDKSLRLLEKELQDLKRTNSRSNDASKTTPKALDSSITKTRRTPLNVTKSRVVEEKKPQIPVKPPTIEKKQQSRSLTKENKEPKEKDIKTTEDKEPKEKEASKADGPLDGRCLPSPKNTNNTRGIVDALPTLQDFIYSMLEDAHVAIRWKHLTALIKAVMKNGASDKSSNEEGVVRRSSRPSKIKDYAKLIRESSQEDDEDSMEYSDNEEEYKEADKSVEGKVKGRRFSNPKAVPKTQPPPLATPRKRGRPRKDQSKEIPNKIVKENDKKEDERETPKSKPVTKLEETSSEVTKPVTKSEETSSEVKPKDAKKPKDSSDSPISGSKNSSPSPTVKSPNESLLMSPTGQTLKKVPIKALPPGIRPMPLPVNARPLGTGELCEMQIGKKVVKVQKIVMTKADVEAMAKKGLVEMKDGTMVLKQGIKLPTTDMLKTSLVGEIPTKESPVKAEVAAPTRCDIEEDS